ncbi:MAG: M48 family metalloprotease [Desulfobacterales bacterium]|nr:M48 family metalloprotease [Desulfobacterales bacterium]
MFGNILYFIIALLIYSTYPVTEQPNFPPGETLLLFAVTVIGFAGFTWLRYRRLAQMGAGRLSRSLAPAVEMLESRLSILALGVFATNVYGLSLPSYLSKVGLFRALPTLQALLFLLLFMGYLIVIWVLGHDLHQKIHGETVSRREQIGSNIQLSTPVLLPWLVLSGFADLLNALPLPPVHRFLSSATGEITYFITFLLAVSVFGPVMIQKFWQCRSLPQGLDRLRIESLCRRAGVRYADILTWPLFGGRMITAGVMGLVGRFRYILVTPALLGFLRSDEIDAVIAHEIGHVKRRHLHYYLLFLTGYMLLSFIVLELIPYLVIAFQPLYNWISHTGIAPTTMMSALVSIGVITVFILYFRFIFGYFMRNFERQADAYVYTLFDSALPMISTFEKIALTSGQAPDRPCWHHFSIAERIAFLRECETDSTRIHRHDRKVCLALALYLVILAAMGAAAWAMNFGETGRILSSQAVEHILRREIEKNPANDDLYTALGDLYFNRKAYTKTHAAYAQAIRLNPKNVQALNNLAWLLATCKDRRLRAPAEALKLAKQAVALNPAPHILDTMAEAYFANGDFPNAVATETMALERAGKEREIFQAQMEKFQRALNGR